MPDFSAILVTIWWNTRLGSQAVIMRVGWLQ